jgi:hypothetical protein
MGQRRVLGRAANYTPGPPVIASPPPSRSQIQSWIAPSRFTPFLDVAMADHAVATHLYLWNARVASACFEVIHHVEVLVRNSMHDQLKASQVDDGVYSWLVDPARLRPAESSSVANVLARLQRSGKSVTDNRVIAGLPLSFWPRLLGRNYDELWKATLHKAFPHGSFKRTDAAGALHRVSQLRNAIAHQKAIFKLPIHERHRDVLDLAGRSTRPRPSGSPASRACRSCWRGRLRR